jgi:hemerythrin
MIEWNEQFKTGFEALDQQHQMLIFNINHLETLLSDTNLTRENWEFLIRLVDFLESYAKRHFRHEEECMERHRCPSHARNKAEHLEFVGFINQFKEEIRHKGIRPEAMADLHRKMSLWIQDHILQVDTQLKSCFGAAI